MANKRIQFVNIKRKRTLTNLRKRNNLKLRKKHSSVGNIQKLFVNGRIERVNLGDNINPEKCLFLPILNQIVVISNVESGAVCYAKPLESEESGYKILTVPLPVLNEMETDSIRDQHPLPINIPANAIKGLSFDECALKFAHIRRKYIQHVRMMNNNNNKCRDRSRVPKLFVRYGEREVFPTKRRQSDEGGYRSKLRSRRNLRASL